MIDVINNRFTFALSNFFKAHCRFSLAHSIIDESKYVIDVINYRFTSAQSNFSLAYFHFACAAVFALLIIVFHSSG